MRFGALSPRKASRLNSSEPTPPAEDPNEVSPELLPIVTLLSAQNHRRYYEGIFMLYYDLNGDGKPADRKWQEVYGILTGNQLAYLDAGNLAKFKDQQDKLLEASNKPNYLNFTDAMFNARAVLPAAKQQLENVIVVLTTLKNRYIIQLRSYDQLKEWYLALRLASFEYQQLQEAYTGALLSARGLRLSDIRTILAEKRFNHEDWVKIRYGSGMAWKRCYAVIEPSTFKRKTFIPGRMLLYESENVKKKNLLGVINSATLVTAVYPQLHFFIDKSTIMKLEGSMNFKLPSKSEKKAVDDILESSIFIMPEQHLAVPGFDTLIRFLVPLFDAFGLYGRPKRLKADRMDPESLVFGLPTLPHVHYLQSSDLNTLVASQQYLSWDAASWNGEFKKILRLKLAQGYDGCGSSRGFLGALSSLNSPRIGSPITSTRPISPDSEKRALRLVSGPLPQFSQPLQQVEAHRVSLAESPRKPEYFGQQLPKARSPQGAAFGGSSKNLQDGDDLKEYPAQGAHKNVNNLAISTSDDPRNSVQLADIYHKYSTIESPSDMFGDRNKILNGSAEEFDEDFLPSLIRKKSLMQGGIYPKNEEHLIDTSESEEEEEDDDGSTDSIYQLEGPLNSGTLKVPEYLQRNSSYSSVQSPLTQYNEFNQQFSKATEQPGRPDLHHSSYQDDSDESEYSASQSPPPVPAHSSPAKQLPQIQQLLLHQQGNVDQRKVSQGDQVATPYPNYREAQPELQQSQMYQLYNPKLAHVQKSQGNTDLNLALKNAPGPVLASTKPRYISSPNSSQNQLPVFETTQAPTQVPRQQANQQGWSQPSQQGPLKPSPTIAPTSAFRVHPQQTPSPQPRPQNQGQQQPTPRHPYYQRVDQGPTPQQGHPNYPQQYQKQPQQGPQNGYNGAQRQQPVQQVHGLQHTIPPRPNVHSQSSSPSIRSYDNSEPIYQTQVQPNFTPRQQYPPQAQYGQLQGQQQYAPQQYGQQQYGQQQGQADPRYILNPNQGYMRKY